MSQERSHQLLRTLPQTLKVPNIEDQDNKKVMLSLKKQMNNIREGMSKLLKVKSQQNIIQTNEYFSSPKTVQKVPTPSNKQQLNQSSLQVKVKKLEEQNAKLRIRVKLLEEQNIKIIEQIVGKKEQLQKQNKFLEGRIKILTQQLQYQNIGKRPRKQMTSLSKKLIPQNEIEAEMNPEYVMIPPIVNQRMMLLQEEKKRMLMDIGIFQLKIKILEENQKRNNLLLFSSNQDKIKYSISRLNKKYEEQKLIFE